MPTSWMWRIGAGLGCIAHRFAKRRKAIVLANLKLVHPELSDEEITSLSKKVFRYSFANLASVLNTGFISPERFKKIASISGTEHFKNIAQNKGFILLIFHMGNWEILSRSNLLVDYQKPFGSIFRPLNNQLISDYITRNRKRDGCQLFPRKRRLIEASKFVRDGGVLGILGDQFSGNAGVKLLLFGKETSITPLPAILAQKYDCPIIPVTVQTIAPGKWHIEIKAPISIDKNLSKSEATKQIIPQMEAIMKQYSPDIFWLHDLWKLKNSL